MTVEEKVFARKRFSVGSMLRFGFEKTENGYEYTTDFMDGDFSAKIFVSDDGVVSGEVFDVMNGEDYPQMRNESFQGGYVNSVRASYEKLLVHIAAECCTEVLFACDQSNRIAAMIEKRYKVVPDFPWKESEHERSGVFRHKDSSKWFALIMNVKRGVLFNSGDDGRVDVINLKADSEKMTELYKIEGVYPAYHMNRKYWISATLDDRIADERLLPLIDDSFDLTDRKRR